MKKDPLQTARMGHSTGEARKGKADSVNKATHVTRGNVIDDLGFSPENATALKFKAELYQAILKYARRYSQRDLQAILGEPQPRISALLNGEVANKSADKLLQYAGRLGIEVRGRFAESHGARKGTAQRRKKFTHSRIGQVSLQDFRLRFGEEAAG